MSFKKFLKLILTSKVYQIAGRGTVATGTVETGSAKKGERVEILGYGRRHNTLVKNLIFFYIISYSDKLPVWKPT